MNVLVVFFHFPPISGGGVIVAVDIVNSLAKIGHKVTVITPNLQWDGPKYEPKIDSKIDVIHVNVPSKNNLKVAARRCKTPLIEKGIEIGRDKKFDFVFTIFHPFHLVPKAAVETAKELKIPSIVKVDDAIYQKSSGIKSIQRKIEKMINGKTLRNSDNVLVANNETKIIVKNEYGVNSKNLFIIPNGVNLSLFKKTTKFDQKKIVFTGAMYYHRGLDILLEAVPKIVKQFSDVKFVLIGSGPELESLKQKVQEKNIEKNIEFTGWMDREDIPKNIGDAILGIGPLRLTDVTKGALPIKVLEYMASSLPIIAKKGTLPREILIDNENGFFIENSDELAEKIMILLDDEKMINSMGQKSFEMVQQFSWNDVVKNIVNVLQKN